MAKQQAEKKNKAAAGQRLRRGNNTPTRCDVKSTAMMGGKVTWMPPSLPLVHDLAYHATGLLLVSECK